MKNASKILIITLILVLSGSICVWAGTVDGLKEFKSGDPALASEVNANFNAVKKAVDSNNDEVKANEAAIGVNSSNIDDNNNRIDELGAQPGVAWKEGASGGSIPTSTAALQSLMLNAPADGYAIVTACGSVYWNIASAASGLVRLKLSETSGDTTETKDKIGVQFIRFQSGLGTGIYAFPFSTTRVFSVSKGVTTFYLNGWHQTVNGSASIDDYNFSAIFVPKSYNYRTIIEPPGDIVIDPRF